MQVKTSETKFRSKIKNHFQRFFQCIHLKEDRNMQKIENYYSISSCIYGISFFKIK